MRYANLKKKAACMLSILSLGTNASSTNAESTNDSLLVPVQNSSGSAGNINIKQDTNNAKEEKIENTSSENSEIDKLKQEIKNNADKKKIYKKNISKLKIDSDMPEATQVPDKKIQKTPASQMVSFIVGLGVIVGLGWAAKSLVSLIWQRLARGVHLKNSKEHKEMLRYTSEFSSFGLAAVKKMAIRISKDKKAALCIINSNDYKNQDVEIDNLGENVENLIIFCLGNKSVNITKLSNKVKKLSVISGSCVKICKSPKVEFFYAKCSGLIFDKKDEFNEESQLKEAVLNIQSFITDTETKEDKIAEGENKVPTISIINTSEELFSSLQQNNAKVFLGGNKPNNAKYKVIKGLISNHGFGRNNWFTIYREDLPN